MDQFAANSMAREWALIAVYAALALWFAYLTTSVIRRRQQITMQKALLEKFATAHDFAEFVQSPAGQKYVMTFAGQVTSPRGSILSSIRNGFVVGLAGAGFLVGGQGSGSMSFRVGWVLFLAGCGLLASAVISFFLAKKIGNEQE
jgi:hypothetical protein